MKHRDWLINAASDANTSSRPLRVMLTNDRHKALIMAGLHSLEASLDNFEMPINETFIGGDGLWPDRWAFKFKDRGIGVAS